MKNSNVAERWAQGEYAFGSNFYTDGTNIFSYKLRIGYTDAIGRKIGIDYRGKHRYSNTTTRHVSHVSSVAKKMVSPDSITE